MHVVAMFLVDFIWCTVWVIEKFKKVGYHERSNGRYRV